jgi:hypothetical protein
MTLHVCKLLLLLFLFFNDTFEVIVMIKKRSIFMKHVFRVALGLFFVGVFSSGVFAHENNFIESSIDEHVLRLTDAGVANYDFTFPSAYILSLSTNTSSDKSFNIWNNGSGLFNLNVEGKLNVGGKVGIGTDSPQANLHVNGTSGLLLTKDEGGPLLTFKDSTGSKAILNLYQSNGDSKFALFGVGGGYGIKHILLRAGTKIELDSDVTIGTTNPVTGYKLTVNGGIYALDLRIRPDLSNTADFVFEEGYPLMSLEQVESKIKANKHLPGIPSAKEMVEEGVSVAEMQAKLLQKIEELTLYVIDQNKEIKTLKEQVKADS